MTHGNYDYGSVMHYSRCGFSDNGYETISVKVHQHLANFCKILNFLSFQGSATIGQRTGMSQTDVNKLMSFYGCWAEAPRIFNAKIEVCESAQLQGDSGSRQLGSGWLFDVPCLSDSALTDGSLAELAGKVGKMMEYPNQS